MKAIIESLKSLIEDKKNEIQLTKAEAEKRWDEFYSTAAKMSEEERMTFFDCCISLDREVQKLEWTLRHLRSALASMRHAIGEEGFSSFEPENDIEK